MQRMAAKFSAAPDFAAVDLKGISADLARLRADPKHKCKARWARHGKRTPLMLAILKSRNSQSLLTSAATK